jgi:16S rRNA (uracil1498-N3)-methyltransferase
MGGPEVKKAMRAIYNPSSKLEENILLTNKESLHHLINVLRIKAGEEILILDGIGGKGTYHVQHITKEKIELSRTKLEMTERYHRISVLLGVPKKDYLEDVIRSCVQLGVNEIYLWESKYAQSNNRLKPERLEKILSNAYEQSNNPFEVKIKNYDELDLEFYDHRILMSVNEESKRDDLKEVNLKLPTLLAIGPEGGFSKEEESELLEKKGFIPMHLNTPILKTTQAVPAGIGALLGALS